MALHRGLRDRRGTGSRATHPRRHRLPVGGRSLAIARRRAAEVQPRSRRASGRDPDGTGSASARAAGAEYRLALATVAASRAGAIHPATLADAVGTALGARGLAVFDGGHTTFWSNDFTPCPAPRTRFHEPGMTHLGFGLPWAIALKRAEPALPVWCITGDGAFGFTLQELDTARREGVAVVVVIHNNASLGVIRHGQERAGFSLGTDLGDTDYAAIARGFGCHGEQVTQADALPAALARAEASGLPAVVDVHVSFEPHPMMPTFGRSSRG